MVIVVSIIAFLLVSPIMGVVLHPFDLPQFTSILSECRLQCPSTSSPQVSNGDFEGVTIEDHFYVHGTDTMVIEMGSVDGGRCELRHNPEWSTESTSTSPQTFHATMKIVPTDIDDVTIMQIHSKDYLGNQSGPPLMLNWRSYRSGITDHLWVRVRMDLSPDSKTNHAYDLGPRPDEFFDLVVTVNDSILRVWVDGDLKLNVDWEFLTLPRNYFKTGIYLHSGNGPQKVQYKHLFMGVLGVLEPESSIPTASPVATVAPTLSPSSNPSLSSSSQPTPRPSSQPTQAFGVEQLILVNTETDQDLFPLDSVNTLDKSLLPPFTIRADLSDSTSSVVFEMDGNFVRQENYSPFSISGDQGGNFNEWEIDDGMYVVTATGIETDNGVDVEGSSLTVIVYIVSSSSSETPTPSPTQSPTQSPSRQPSSQPSSQPTALPTDSPTLPLMTASPTIHLGLHVIDLIVVNADTDEDMFTLSQTSENVLDTSLLPHISIRAQVPPGEAESVWFTVNGQVVQMENIEPFCIAGDSPQGDYNPWIVQAGQYEVTATPYTKSGGQGTEGTPLTVLVSIL